MLLICAIFALAQSLQINDVRLAGGDLDNEDFYTVGVFCFDVDPAGGSVGTYSFTASWDESVTNMDNLQLLAYSDQDEFWPMIFNSNTGQFKDMTCEEKISYSNLGVDSLMQNGVAVENHIRQARRPRFWYYALANCGGSLDGVTVSGSMLNNEMSKELNWEFGVNEQGLQLMYLFFLIVYMLYLPLNAYVVYKLYAKYQAVHQFVQIFCFVLLLQFIAISMYVSHFWTFMNNGVGRIGIYYLGQGVDIITRVFFMAVLMFLAEGWTISQVSLEKRSKMMILGSLFAVTIIYLALLLWDYLGRTPEMVRPVLVQQVLFQILIGIWILFAIWFVITCRKSYMSMTGTSETDSAKKTLFLMLGCVYGVWNLSLPVIQYVSLLLDPWVFDIVMQTSTITITTCGYFFFTAIIWPSRSTKFFEPPQRQVSVDEAEYNRL